MVQQGSRTGSSTPNSDERSLFFPEASRREWLVTLVVFLVSCAYLRIFRDGGVVGRDEGIVLQGAARILRGQVLYRDFFSFMTPGSFYWMAVLFKVFGSSMLVARTQLIVYGGLFSSITYLIARRASSRWASLTMTYLLLVSMLPFRFQALHNWDSTLWALVAFYTAVLLIQTKNSIWAFGAGTFTAWTFLFEQSKGAGLALGLFVAFAFLAFVKSGRGTAWRAPSLWLTASGGFAWPFVIVFAYWAHEGALAEMWNDWLWPLYHYTAANSTVYGILFPNYQDWIDIFGGASWAARAIIAFILSPCIVIGLLPLLAFGALGVSLNDLLRARRNNVAVSFDTIVSAVACGAGLSIVIKRAEVSQMVFVEPLLILLLAWILERRRPVRWLPMVRPWKLVVYLLVSFTLFGLIFVKIALQPQVAVTSRRGKVRTEKDIAALEYLMANSHSGEKVLVYPYAANLYFLTDTYSPTEFDYLQPGVHTRHQFEEAVGAVRADRTPLILYELSFFSDLLPRAWPSTPPASLAQEPLGILLKTAYKPCSVMGRPANDRFVAFWRKDLPCPPNPAP